MPSLNALKPEKLQNESQRYFVTSGTLERGASGTAILSTLSGWRLLAVTPWVRVRARLVGAHSTVARARTQGSGKRSMQIGKTLKLHPNIGLVVAEMSPCTLIMILSGSHNLLVVYTERRDCDRISNDPVMLHFKFPLQSH